MKLGLFGGFGKPMSVGLRGGPSDTIAPTVAITLSDYTITVGDTPTVTFTFSEAPSGFMVANVTAPNGSLSSFGVTGNPLVYTAVFTPTAGVVDATNVITVDANWTDAAGNPPAGSTNSDNYTIDTGYSISGTVFDADGTTAVASATVALGALTATSGADGTYTISSVPAGTSGSMTATKAGYTWTAIVVAAMNGNLTNQNFSNMQPNSITCNGTTYINCGSDAALDNLHAGAFTVEGWLYIATFAGNYRPIFGKNNDGDAGWILRCYNSGILNVQVRFDTTDVNENTGAVTFCGAWHHYAITWDYNGDKKARVYLDGTNIKTTAAGVGNIQSDAALNFVIGALTAGASPLPTDSKIAWVRVSNNVRYSTNFTAPGRLVPPVVDANVIAQWSIRDGSGATADNAEGTATRDGTIVNGVWEFSP